MKKLIPVLTAFLLAGSACAASIVTAQDGFYIGGLAGYGEPELSKTEYNNIAGMNSTSSNVGSIAWSSFVGFQWATALNWLTGIEGGYDEDGDANYNFSNGSMKVKSSDFDALLTETYLFNSGFNIFGKAGAARFDQKTVGYGGLAGQQDNTRTRPIAKIGAGYLLDYGSRGRLNLFAQYAHVFASDGGSKGVNFSNNIISTDTIGGGLTYTFPT